VAADHRQHLVDVVPVDEIRIVEACHCSSKRGGREWTAKGRPLPLCRATGAISGSPLGGRRRFLSARLWPRRLILIAHLGGPRGPGLLFVVVDDRPFRDAGGYGSRLGHDRIRDAQGLQRHDLDLNELHRLAIPGGESGRQRYCRGQREMDDERDDDARYTSSPITSGEPLLEKEIECLLQFRFSGLGSGAQYLRTFGDQADMSDAALMKHVEHFDDLAVGKLPVTLEKDAVVAPGFEQGPQALH